MLSSCDDYRGVKLDLSTRPVWFGGQSISCPTDKTQKGFARAASRATRGSRFTSEIVVSNRSRFLEKVAIVSEDLKIAGIQFNTMGAATEKILLLMLSLVLGKNT